MSTRPLNSNPDMQQTNSAWEGHTRVSEAQPQHPDQVIPGHSLDRTDPGLTDDDRQQTPSTHLGEAPWQHPDQVVPGHRLQGNAPVVMPKAHQADHIQRDPERRLVNVNRSLRPHRMDPVDDPLGAGRDHRKLALDVGGGEGGCYSPADGLPGRVGGAGQEVWAAVGVAHLGRLGAREECRSTLSAMFWECEIAWLIVRRFVDESHHSKEIPSRQTSDS